MVFKAETWLKHLAPLSADERRRAQREPRSPSSFAQISPGAFVVDPHRRLRANPKGLERIFPKTCSLQALKWDPNAAGPIAPSGKKPKLAVVFSGGPAPGGHNVLYGIAKALAPHGGELIGFLGGPSGILNNEAIELPLSLLESYRNSGGFSLIGTGRTKLSSEDQFARASDVLISRGLDGLVVIGGDDSNTNAAFLAEYVAQRDLPLTIVGVPKTIDGDLVNDHIEATFGFDTAASVYASLASHVAKDVQSTRKYYHFIRLMGRAASHLAVEVARRIKPNLVLVGEEVRARKLSLNDVVKQIANLVVERSKLGLQHGVVIIPEGLIEFIPDLNALIVELNVVLHEHREYIANLRGYTETYEFVIHKLSKDSTYCFSNLPVDIQRQLLLDRDPHGNVIVSMIETELLLIELVQQQLSEMNAKGDYQGKFAVQRHFFGYEGRCAAPTIFDAEYSYTLGLGAGRLAMQQANGYIVSVGDLANDIELWKPRGVPLYAMMEEEERGNRRNWVVSRSLVDAHSDWFAEFNKDRQTWQLVDHYNFCSLDGHDDQRRPLNLSDFGTSEGR